MSKMICVANQKGGVGKTTTAINLSCALGELGKKVLLIDMDPQGNSTSGLGLDKETQENTIYDLLISDLAVESCLVREIQKNLDIIPANVNLSGAEIELIGVDRKEYILREKIEEIRNDYDYILVDCPPSLSMLTVNAMSAADAVMVPIQCEYYALEGLGLLLHTLELIKERLNPYLEIDGVVFTMFDSRTNLSMQVVENVRENLTHHVYETVIPRNVRLAEAPSFGMPINVYDKKSAGAEAYLKLAKEVMERS